MSGAIRGARFGSEGVADVRADRYAFADADGHLTVETFSARTGAG